jgi:hypothetical protein
VVKAVSPGSIRMHLAAVDSLPMKECMAWPQDAALSVLEEPTRPKASCAGRPVISLQVERQLARLVRLRHAESSPALAATLLGSPA